MRQDSTRQNTHDHFWFQYDFWSVPGTKRNCPVPDRKSTVEGRSNLKIGEKEVHDASDRWPHLEVERSKVKVTRPLRKSAISSERKVYKLRTWYILQMKYTMTRIAELRGEWPEKSEVKVMTSRRQLDAWQRKVTETPKLAAIAHCDPPIAVNSFRPLWGWAQTAGSVHGLCCTSYIQQSVQSMSYRSLGVARPSECWPNVGLGVFTALSLPWINAYAKGWSSLNRRVRRCYATDKVFRVKLLLVYNFHREVGLLWAGILMRSCWILFWMQ